MPEITSCPDCEKKLRVPDDLIGKKVRCPGCSVMFIAQPGVGLPEEPARAAKSLADQEPSRARSTPERDSGRGYRSDGYSERASPPPAYRDGYADRSLPRGRDDYDDDRRGRGRDDDYDRDRGRRDDDRDDYDRDRRRRDDDYDDRRAALATWRVRGAGVRMGLNLVIIGGWLSIAMWGIMAIGLGLFMILGISMFTSAAAAPSNRMAGQAASGVVAMGLGVMLFMGVIGLVMLAEVVLRLVGYAMCMQVPSARNSASKPLAIAAFSCAAGAVFLNWVGMGIGMGSVGFRGAGPMMMMSGFHDAFGWLSSVLAFAGFICFVIFLRCVAVQLRDSDLARRVIIFLICDICFYGFAFLMAIVIGVIIVASGFSAMGSMMQGGSAQGAARAMGAGIIISILLGGLLFLGYLGMQIWHIFVVTHVRTAVDRQLARL